MAAMTGEVAPLFRSSDPASALGEHLQQLKADGCSILVTGNVDPRATKTLSQQLLGSPVVFRHRVVAGVDVAPPALDDYLPPGLVAAHSGVHLFALSTMGRGATATVSANDTMAMGQHWQDAVRTVSSLEALEAELLAKLDTLAETRELPPGTLRVGLTTLRPLFDTYDETTVVEFVRRLGATVEEHHGMAHFHFPVTNDDPRINVLADLVAITIELRLTNTGHVEQRWQTTDHEPSDWFSV